MGMGVINGDGHGDVDENEDCMGNGDVEWGVGWIGGHGLAAALDSHQLPCAARQHPLLYKT